MREGGLFDIAIWERDREVLSRLTFGDDNYAQTWNPAGDRLAFRSNRGGRYEIWSIAADGYLSKISTVMSSTTTARSM